MLLCSTLEYGFIVLSSGKWISFQMYPGKQMKLYSLNMHNNSKTLQQNKNFLFLDNDH